MEVGAHSLRAAVAHAMDHPVAGTELRVRWERENTAANAALPEEFQVSDNQAEWRAAVDVLLLDASDRRASGRQVGIGGRSLQSIHVYVLAQLLGRPIVVVADDATSAAAEAGDSLGGIYLPSLRAADKVSRDSLAPACESFSSPPP